ncbi:hypothetical protein [Shewanella glacialipiscicola]|uniref:hypothetical protein n=1 Tax=Shewanella glacialipiscicola TaxID=614069 RepID=UPI0021D8D78D|nr:hypothetical protein [Shewanella glacialipiscicola]MCU7995079.1 hypothetical protein [Shewanella glacialipiscicola]MCU8026487.1 hypothetical protein [Shewanella glacialipiscicola]
MFISKKCPHCKSKLRAKDLPIKQGRCCHCDKPILFKLNRIKFFVLFVPIYTVLILLLDKEVYGFWICFSVMMPIITLVYLFSNEVVKWSETDEVDNAVE